MRRLHDFKIYTNNKKTAFSGGGKSIHYYDFPYVRMIFRDSLRIKSYNIITPNNPLIMGEIQIATYRSLEKICFSKFF